MGWHKQIIVLFLCAVFSFTAKAEGPKQVRVEIAHAFVPIGFDDNDKAQVVVAGIFPSTCYKVGPTIVSVDKKTKTLSFNQSAYYYPGDCLMMKVPFTQVVDLGILSEGLFKLKDDYSGRTFGALPVLRSKTLAADDFLYAPVTDAYVQNEEGKSVLRLHGNFTDRCMTLKEVKVFYQDGVIVVQPIAEYAGVPHNCGHQIVRFEYEQPLVDGLKGMRLIHVRSMEGQAINRMVEFQ